jgi:argininosuccinate synthase
MAKTSGLNKIVLSYSGGLDTTAILKWLQETYECEVVTFTADLGDGDDYSPVRQKALNSGAVEAFVDDVREEFVRDFVYPMFRCNTIYEGEYLLGTSIARPLIAKRLVEIAAETNADAIKVVAPWREWDLTSRESLLAFCEKHQIPVDRKHEGSKSPYSMDANLLHISYEGGILEDPNAEPEEAMWLWSVAPEAAPDAATYVELTYVRGDVVAIDGVAMTPATVLTHLNKVGGANGIGRVDIVENRYVGMKARGCYETPGGTILMKGHRAMESITLDRELGHLKDELMPRYAKLIYNGYWWSPERLALQALIDASQTYVNGTVRLKLYKGNVMVVGRDSASDSLYDSKIVTFEDDAGAYNQQDASGFIRLNALRLRVEATKGRKLG